MRFLLHLSYKYSKKEVLGPDSVNKKTPFKYSRKLPLRGISARSGSHGIKPPAGKCSAGKCSAAGRKCPADKCLIAKRLVGKCLATAEMGNIYWYWIILRNIDNSIVNSIDIAIEKVGSMILILLLNIVKPNSKYWNWLSLLTDSKTILILNIDYWLAVYQYWYWILTIE